MATSPQSSASGTVTTTTSAVLIQNLHYSFGSGDLTKQVLFDINLALPRGQIVIMTGPSGSGKTTLLTLIGALRTAHEGSLQVLGQEVVGLSRRKLVSVRRNIGFIFQAHNLFESLTAAQNVEMAVELKGQFGQSDRRPSRFWPNWASAIALTISRGPSRGGKSNEWRSPAPW
jgi:putative ABC transport system ATP-binding protein